MFIKWNVCKSDGVYYYAVYIPKHYCKVYRYVFMINQHACIDINTVQ